MPQPHYVIRRSRMGRFNFTLLGQHGRLTGVVVVPTENRTKPEVEEEARAKIRALARELVETAGPTE
ncbi:hypothetical protein [Methylobacterium iners]|uniref:DUF1508 domain-containing protein n=1 Tax=Methylobacterium iners TaxID=418707 RepID=A0ABQ4S070_9HYPH|nr:hypothetical protein [Methylobacterium iners]GJD95268.1 hypothetical protein OCOJLMKI_2479 [Methylobacterium iners]